MSAAPCPYLAVCDALADGKLLRQALALAGVSMRDWRQALQADAALQEQYRHALRDGAAALVSDGQAVIERAVALALDDPECSPARASVAVRAAQVQAGYALSLAERFDRETFAPRQQLAHSGSVTCAPPVFFVPAKRGDQ